MAAVDIRSARSALLIDASSGKALFERDPSKKLPAAGLARLAPLLVICEAFDRGDISGEMPVTVDEAAARIGGTTAFLRAGETMDAQSLLLAAVMINAGDATHALAAAACGSDTAAISAVNERLAGLGVDSVYTDICGAEQSFSALELAAIASALIKSPTYLKYSTKYYEHISHESAGETELASPNKLIKQYSGCIGVGTGSSASAGYCGLFAARRGESAYIAVVLGAKNGAERFETGRELLDHGFSAFRSVRVSGAGEAFGTVSVSGSLVREINAEAADDTFLLLSMNKREYTLEALLPDSLSAPVEKGERIGTLTVRANDGEVLAETPLVADKSAAKAGFSDFFRIALNGFLHIG